MTISMRAKSRILKLDEDAGDWGSARCVRQARARSHGIKIHIKKLRDLFFLMDWKQCEEV
jgi:hypothetical protein